MNEAKPHDIGLIMVSVNGVLIPACWRHSFEDACETARLLNRAQNARVCKPHERRTYYAVQVSDQLSPDDSLLVITSKDR